jgi:DNA uptake protein ComE-like DNA-binding protein
MERESGRISVAAIVMSGALVALYFGPMQIPNLLQGYGWLRSPSPEVVEGELRRMNPSGTESYDCRDGSDGWDAICDVVSTRGGRPSRLKYGVVSSAFSPAASISVLPVDQPTPSRDQYVSRQAENEKRAAAEQKRLTATLDLNRARVDQLKKLPGVDDALAQRIAIAVIHKRFKTVDDLLTVEGVDRQMLERIRPLVRVDK